MSRPYTPTPSGSPVYPSPPSRDGGAPFIPPDLGPSRGSVAIHPQVYQPPVPVNDEIYIPPEPSYLTSTPGIGSRSPSMAPVIVPGPQIASHLLFLCTPSFAAASKPTRQNSKSSAFGKSSSPYSRPTDDNCPPANWCRSSSSSIGPFYPACVRPACFSSACSATVPGGSFSPPRPFRTL